jgi:TMEM175 potassium channel family protein
MSKGRVEAFSDGVFAVAATLLIFNIQLDKTAPGGLLAALLAAWPKYAAYVASFLTIGVMWINHHGLFERIARLNRTLVFLNLLLLMAIVFLPFPTALLGSNILVPHDANTAASLYALNAVVISIFFSAVWTYALTHPALLAPDVDRQAAMRSWPRFSVGVVAYLVCVPIGQFSPVAVVVICAALAVYYMFERLPNITRQSAAGARPLR